MQKDETQPKQKESDKIESSNETTTFAQGAKAEESEKQLYRKEIERLTYKPCSRCVTRR